MTQRRTLHPGRILLAAAATLFAGACATIPTHPERDRIAPAQPATPPPKTASAPEEGATATAAGPLTLDLPDAILLALENNRGLAIQRLEPQIRRTTEETARAAFDPTLAASFARERSRDDRRAAAGQRPHTDAWTAAAGASQFLPTGTTLEASLQASKTIQDATATATDNSSSAAGLTITQALLRGFGATVNLATLRQARLDTLSSQYELRGYAETLVADVEKTYWDLILARSQAGIVSRSLTLAEKQLAEIRERIQVGKLAPTEQAAAEAELALRHEELIDAESTAAKLHVRLLRLLSPATTAGATSFDRVLTLTATPELPNRQLEPAETHVRRALDHRADLNQARLQLQRNELELVQTRNGLLPKLDLFISLGQSGYADSFAGAWRDNDGDDYALTAGLKLEFPPANREARARHTRATLTQAQAREALANQAQLAEEDVRSAWLEIQRTRAQVAATAATQRLQQEKSRVESERFRVGKTTSLQLAQTQRDALASELAATRAVAASLNAWVDLYKAEGILLEMRGIAAPATEPIPAP
ncbi:MAG: TolC family protein [Lentisphaeria bacterium]|jgi:outer membrane protein TolC